MPLDGLRVLDLFAGGAVTMGKAPA